MKFWETERYKDAHLAKLDLPEDVVQKIFNWVKKGKDMLVFTGNPGCGKTYFSAAYIHSLIEKKYPYRYYHEKELYSALRADIAKGWDYEDSLERICNDTHFMVLDDIGSAQMTEWQIEVINNFLDLRYNNRFPTVITSNILVKDSSEFFSKRIHSRLASKDNAVIELQYKDKRLE